LEGWEWNAVEGDLTKQYQFPNFAENMRFVNQIAALAEAEGHHPDLYIQYNILDITLSTHVISGLSENDFILAAKIDHLSH
jgi:4a-hydroxytetrahydrobiopterin dehydratase